jgi:hypothetical protein
MVRIEPGGTPVVQPPPTTRPSPSATPAARATTGDALERAQDAGPFATARAGAATGGGLTPAELESAQQAIANASDGRSAEPVVAWLRSHPDDAKRDAFMDLLFKFGPVAVEVLDSAYTRRLPSADVEVLGQALGHAWRSGTVTAQELRDAVATGGRGAAFGAEHIGMALVVGQAGDPGLATTYMGRELEIFRGNPDEVARANAIAVVMGSLSPETLSPLLSDTGLVDSLLAALDRCQRTMGGSDFGLARLIEGAARIEPATPAPLRLFTESIGRLGHGGHLPEAMASFYARHSGAILAGWMDDSGSLRLEGQEQLSLLFARTLYSDLQGMGQEVLQAALAADLGRRSTALEAHARTNPPSIAALREARLLGSLVGAIEGGFQVAVDELEQRNAAIDSMVDLMFRTTALLPKVSVPDLGVLAGQAQSLAEDRLKEWVKARLHEDPRDASEAVPFHQLFGQEIDHPTLRTGYDAARADAFLNRAMDLR